MPLTKLTLKPGMNRERTRYSNENGYYTGDKVRFRQGFPEKIGGWVRLSDNTFLGTCRSLFNWVTLGGSDLMGVGTHIKFYIERGGSYSDITPLRATATLTDPFDTTDGETSVVVTDTAHGATAGSYVTFSGATAVGGLTLNGEYVITTVIDVDSYTITAASPASATANGGGTVDADYQINIGADISVPVSGWGGGGWGLGTWGNGGSSVSSLRLWSQSNFGEDLVFNYRGGPIFYWDASGGLTTRAINLTDLGGASDVPVAANFVFVSDVSRFVIAFGCSPYLGTDISPMLVRWSNQEDAGMWTPDPLNQSGELQLSHGAYIVGAMQSRQEVLVWTDVALYSLQYLGLPEVWGAQLLADNVSIINQNCMITSHGVTYWMGRDTFYKYDGTVTPLPCDLKRSVFSDFNYAQEAQAFVGDNERFNEIWWFYCSSGSMTVDRYVVYNHTENLWYSGTMARTAWLDGSVRDYPIAATYNNKLVYHERGVDDYENTLPAAIESYVESAPFDLQDGDRFVFIRRVLPDVTFDGSTADNPAVLFEVSPMGNAGSGYNSPLSEGGDASASVTRTASAPIEEFTGQVYIRVRGRQMVMRVSSDAVGVAWQWGTPRFDIKPDGRRG